MCVCFRRNVTRGWLELDTARTAHGPMIKARFHAPLTPPRPAPGDSVLISIVRAVKEQLDEVERELDEYRQLVKQLQTRSAPTTNTMRIATAPLTRPT